ncbi:unnamed protein product [Euphydryas editha]|uniref:Brix domain-containing protein n=1 Tax=Euphydryas editha TaxID=104508 RepID=A0AAU9UU19_EUPED|nr:unnamed protein product [Euphydryas editha]
MVVFSVKKSFFMVLRHLLNDGWDMLNNEDLFQSRKDIELTEIGPRFQMKLYEIKLGTLEALDAADTGWPLRPYMNTAAKRRFLSNEDSWQDEE